MRSSGHMHKGTRESEVVTIEREGDTKANAHDADAGTQTRRRQDGKTILQAAMAH